MQNLKNLQLNNLKQNLERKPYGPVNEFYQFPLALLEIMQLAANVDADNGHKLKTIAGSMLNMISDDPAGLPELANLKGNQA